MDLTLTSICKIDKKIERHQEDVARLNNHNVNIRATKAAAKCSPVSVAYFFLIAETIQGVGIARKNLCY